MSLDQAAQQLFLKLVRLQTRQLFLETLAQSIPQFLQRGALTVIFGKIVVERRQDFALDFVGN